MSSFFDIMKRYCYRHTDNMFQCFDVVLLVTMGLPVVKHRFLAIYLAILASIVVYHIFVNLSIILVPISYFHVHFITNRRSNTRTLWMVRYPISMLQYCYSNCLRTNTYIFYGHGARVELQPLNIHQILKKESKFFDCFSILWYW